MKRFYLFSINVYFLSLILWDWNWFFLTRDFYGPTVLFSSILIWRASKKNPLSIDTILFYTLGIQFLCFVFYTGCYQLPESYVPKQKLYIKGLYTVSLILALFEIYRNKIHAFNAVVLVASSSLLLSWVYQTSPTTILPYFLYGLGLYVYFEKDINPSTKLERILYFILICSFLTSFFFSFDSFRSMKEFFYLFYGILVLGYLLQYKTKIKKDLLLYFCLYYIFTLIIFSIFIGFYLFQSEGKKFLDTNVGSFQVNSFGSLVAASLPIFLLSFKIKKLFKFRNYVLGIILFSIFNVYFGHSRASLLGLGLSLSLFWYFLMRKRLSTSTKYFIMISPLFVLLLGICLLVFFPGDWVHAYLNTESLVIRISLWKIFIFNTIEHGLFFGLGPSTEWVHSVFQSSYLNRDDIQIYENLIRFTNNFTHAHNLYIQIFANFGIVGLGLFLWIGGYYLTYLIRSRKFLYSRISLVGIVAIFIQEFFDYTYPDLSTFLPMILFLFLSYREKPSQRITKVPIQNIVSLFIIVFVSLYSWNAKISERLKFETSPFFLLDHFGNPYVNSGKPHGLIGFDRWNPYYIDSIYPVDLEFSYFRGRLLEENGRDGTMYYKQCSSASSYKIGCVWGMKESEKTDLLNKYQFFLK